MFPVLAAALLAGATPSPQDLSQIRWIENDWPKAKAQAAEEGQLVFVDVWATWCHTCLSMKHFVLTSAKMKPVAKSFTFLAVDFDRPENAAYFAKFPAAGFPTFLVVDPRTESVVGRWIGSGTAEQMVAFLREAGPDSKDPVVLGGRALAREDFAEARAIFEGALAKPAVGAATKVRLLSGLVEALSHLDPKACAQVGREHLAEADATAPAVDMIATVADCADGLEPAEKKTVLEAVRDRLTAIAEGETPNLSVDDQSGLLAVLIDIHETLGDKKTAEAVAKARVNLLENAASRAETPELRATFDAHLADEYIRAKRFEDAEKMILASQAAQPKDFNHPLRLARVYLESGKTAEGLTAVDRALALGYGARRLRMYSVKVDLLLESKRYQDARATVAKGLAEASKLGKGQVRPSSIKELEDKLKKIDKREKGAS